MADVGSQTQLEEDRLRGPQRQCFPRTPDHRLRSVVSFTLPSSGERWNWPVDRVDVDVLVEVLDRAGIAWKVSHG